MNKKLPSFKKFEFSAPRSQNVPSHIASEPAEQAAVTGEIKCFCVLLMSNFMFIRITGCHDSGYSQFFQ
jgi:hypothetical protein